MMNNRFLGIRYVALYIIILVIIITVVYNLLNKEKVCQFCQRTAKWNRSPKIEAVRVYASRDMTLSYAELQNVYCCDECRAIAGGFRTTQWKCIKDCELPK